MDDRQPGELTSMALDGNGVCVIAPDGELDLVTVEPVREELDAAIAAGVSAVIFELERVTFLDSSALALFAYSLRHVPTTLRNPSEIVRRVLVQTGLDRALQVEP